MDIVYEALKKIPGMSDNDAHEVASKLNRFDDVATKADILELKIEIRSIKWVIGLLVALNIGMFLKLFL